MSQWQVDWQAQEIARLEAIIKAVQDELDFWYLNGDLDTWNYEKFGRLLEGK